MLKLSAPYQIIDPPITSGSTFYFKTDSGIHYEVRFGRKQNNILSTSIVFGVINDEFEGEEYSMTNRHEVFRVMSTIVKIVKRYMQLHPKIRCYEYTGEPSSNEKQHEKSGKVRLRLYNRYLKEVFKKDWQIEQFDNKTIISKST